jgi:hypothetical protein
MTHRKFKPLIINKLDPSLALRSGSKCGGIEKISVGLRIPLKKNVEEKSPFLLAKMLLKTHDIASFAKISLKINEITSFEGVLNEAKFPFLPNFFTLARQCRSRVVRTQPKDFRRYNAWFALLSQ